MSHITNPSAGGGGGGSVTSVDGGQGITTTPDPITTVGIVDLDIFKLAPETVLASGDWLPFLDVSAGTDPDDQRRVTLGDLADFVEASMGGPFQPLDAGLTALASLTPAGIAVTDGADGWLTRSIAVTDTATIDFTITNPTGVAGNPTITGSVLAAGISGLGFVDGTGVANQVAFWADANTLAGDTALVYDPTLDDLNLNGQMVIGSLAAPTTAAALLDLQSTTGALTLSRLTTAQAAAISADLRRGMLYYNTTLDQFKIIEESPIAIRTPLVLEGRSGTTNNPVLSSTTGGRITGGNNGILELRGNTLSTLTGEVDVMNRLRVDMNLAGQTLSSNHDHIIVYNDGALGVANIDTAIVVRTLNHTGTYNVTTDGFGGFQMFNSQPIVTTDTGLGALTLGATSGVFIRPAFTPGTGTSLTDGGFRGFAMDPTFSNSGTGNTLTNVRHGASLGTLGATWTATDWSHTLMSPPSGTGTITRLGFAEIDDLATFAGTLTTTPYSLWSKGTTVHMLHAGPVRLGDATAPVQKLEVLGNILLDNFGSSAELRIREPSGGGSSHTGFRAPALAANLVYTLPDAFPTISGQVLSATTGGVMSWATAGGGSGTVTSVAGGVGITNTPEPITTTGTVDLDINSLTTETTLASGDLFAFVDVSVGTSPASQRKVTLANIAVGLNALGTLDHGTLAGLADDDHAQYLLRAGRTTTTNDYALTTTAAGTGTGAGGTDAAAIYRLRSSSSGSAHTGTIDLDDQTRIRPTAATITTATYNLVDIFSSSFTWNSANLRIFNLASTITVDADITGFLGWRFNPTFLSQTAESHALGTHTALQFAPTYTPVTGQALTNLVLRAVNHNPTFTDAGTGNTATSSYGLIMGGLINTNWTLSDRAGLHVDDDAGTGGTITRNGAVEIEDLTRGTSNYSAWSKGASVFLAHSGPAIIGASQSTLTAPNANLKLDLAGALALRRIADVTLVNGSNTAVAVGNSSFIRVVGPTAAFTIHGIAGGVDGKFLLIYNTVAFNMTIADESGTEGTAANRIKTMSGANQSTTAVGFAMLIYDSSQSRWICLTIQA